jgi:hypothetical protein
VTATEVIELRTVLDARRRELGLRWWQISVQADVGSTALQQMAYGVASERTHQAVQDWLDRHPTASRMDHAPTTGEETAP